MILLSKTNKFKNITFKQGLSELKHENQIYIGIKENDDEMIFGLEPLYSSIVDYDNTVVEVHDVIPETGYASLVWTTGYIDMMRIDDVIGEDFQINVDTHMPLDDLRDYNLYIKKEK